MCLSIKSGAIFVADSHYNEKNQQFLSFLEKLKSKEIKTSQLFLMGDMFDFISGESKYFVKRNQELIDIINDLSQTIEIIYLEGNHDYNMQSLFSKVKVYKREVQPIEVSYEGESISLAHGDIFTPWHYDLYCKIIRNRPLLIFLNMIDFNNFISKKIYYGLLKKSICSKMKNFEEFAIKRLSYYKSDVVIEGHFHQGKTFRKNKQLYVNIPSLCCDEKYMVFENEFKGIDL